MNNEHTTGRMSAAEIALLTQAEKDFILINLDPKMQILLKDTSEVLFFMGDDDYVKVYFVNGKCKQYPACLKDVIIFLDPEIFYDGHKSYITNVKLATGSQSRGGWRKVFFGDAVETSRISKFFKAGFKAQFNKLHPERK